MRPLRWRIRSGAAFLWAAEFVYRQRILWWTATALVSTNGKEAELTGAT
jgi:hypothetical protein